MHFLCTLFIFPLLIAAQARVLVEEPSSLVDSVASNVPPLHEDAVQVGNALKEGEKLTPLSYTVEPPLELNNATQTKSGKEMEVGSDKVDSEVKTEPSNDISTESPEINPIQSEDASQRRGFFGVGNGNDGSYQQIALAYDFPTQSDTEKIFKFPIKVVAIQPPTTTTSTTTTTTTTPAPSDTASTTTTTTTTPAPILYKPIKPWFFSPFLKPIALAPTSSSSSSSSANAYNNNYYGLGMMLLPKPFLFKSGASLLGERSVSDSTDDSFNLNGADDKTGLDVLKVCMFLDTNLIKQILKENSAANELSSESEATTPEEQFETQPKFEQEIEKLQNEQVKEEVNEPPKEEESKNEQPKEDSATNELSSESETTSPEEQFETQTKFEQETNELQNNQVKEEVNEPPKEEENKNEQQKEEVNELPKDIQN